MHLIKLTLTFDVIYYTIIDFWWGLHHDISTLEIWYWPRWMKSSRVDKSWCQPISKFIKYFIKSIKNLYLESLYSKAFNLWRKLNKNCYLIKQRVHVKLGIILWRPNLLYIYSPMAAFIHLWNTIFSLQQILLRNIERGLGKSETRHFGSI